MQKCRGYLPLYIFLLQEGCRSSHNVFDFFVLQSCRGYLLGEFKLEIIQTTLWPPPNNLCIFHQKSHADVVLVFPATVPLCECFRILGIIYLCKRTIGLNHCDFCPCRCMHYLYIPNLSSGDPLDPSGCPLDAFWAPSGHPLDILWTSSGILWTISGLPLYILLWTTSAGHSLYMIFYPLMHGWFNPLDILLTSSRHSL